MASTTTALPAPAHTKEASGEQIEDEEFPDGGADDSTADVPHIMEEEIPMLEDKIGEAHVNILPTKKLIICMLGLSLPLFAAFIDQTSVTVALTYIAKDLNAEKSINWAGTSSLLANTVCQVLFGRFADIFGRKEILLFCMALLLVSNLLCGFAESGPEFYIFRAMAGIGSGGISCLVMVIVSDVVTLKQRGKFQGFTGVSVALGNGVGPIIMAAFAMGSTWRNFYRVVPPVMAVLLVIVFFVVPSNRSRVNSSVPVKTRVGKIDYIGIFFATAALTLLLIPISGGGSTYAWDSALVISMFVIGGLCLIVFLVVEGTIPELPMIPLSLFKNKSLCIHLMSSCLFGMAWYSFVFAVPYYFELVKGYSIMRSALLLLPLTLPQTVFSTLAGSLMSYFGHYLHIVIIGYAIWLAAHAMTLCWSVDTRISLIVGNLFLLGTGSGLIFQPTIVAAQANSRKAQRAVVISTRNVARSFGGALGTAISSLIITNTLLKEIDSQSDSSELPASYLKYLKDHIFGHPEISTLTSSQRAVVSKMYMKAMKNYFYFTVPLLGICFLSCFLTKDNGLQCLDELPAQEEKPSSMKQ